MALPVNESTPLGVPPGAAGSRRRCALPARARPRVAFVHLAVRRATSWRGSPHVLEHLDVAVIRVRDVEPVLAVHVKPGGKPEAAGTRARAADVQQQPSPPELGAQPQQAPQQFVAASQAPPVSLDGFCPVTLLETKKWKKADPQFGAIHRGRTYLFANADQQKKFLANPDAFAPVLSGYDPVRFATTGKLVEGSRAYGVITHGDNRIFL